MAKLPSNAIGLESAQVMHVLLRWVVKLEAWGGNPMALDSPFVNSPGDKAKLKP